MLGLVERRMEGSHPSRTQRAFGFWEPLQHTLAIQQSVEIAQLSVQVALWKNLLHVTGHLGIGRKGAKRRFRRSSQGYISSLEGVDVVVAFRFPVVKL